MHHIVTVVSLSAATEVWRGESGGKCKTVIGTQHSVQKE